MKTIYPTTKRRRRTNILDKAITLLLCVACTGWAIGQRTGDGGIQYPGQAIQLAVASATSTDALNPAMPFTQRSSSNMLATPMCYDNSGFGIMFDVEAITNITVENLEANLGAATSHDIEIFYKSGSHVGFENNPAAWSQLGALTNVPSNGEDSLTWIPLDINVTIAAGGTVSFYIAVTSALPNPIGHPTHLLYTNGAGLSSIFVADSNVMVKEGTGIGVPSVQPFQGGLYAPRRFNGAIHYDLCGGADGQDPILTCQQTTVVMNCGSAIDPWATGMPSVSDDFDDHPYIDWEDVLMYTNECPEVLTVTRTFFAEDLCGNTDSCVQMIVVSDSEPPVMECPPDVTVGLNTSTAPPGTGMLYTYDECSMQPFISWEDVIAPATDCPVLEVISRTWMSVDDCGNTGVCVQHIAIADLTTPPVIECLPAVTVSCSELATFAAANAVSATDCGDVTLSFSDVSGPGDCAGDEIVERTWTATDEQGNTATCNQTIYVVDDVPPALVQCSDNIALECMDRMVVDFNNLETAEVITTIESGELEIAVQAYSKGGQEQNVLVFNTAQPTGGDTDLGTPNVMFGGPGQSEMSPDGYEGSNNRGIGQALVIQNPNTYPTPDDYFLSDSIIFEFDQPVFVESVTMVDLELPQAEMGAGAFLLDNDNVLIAFIPFSGGADNSIEDVCIMVPGVTKLIIYFGSTIPASGAVARLTYIPIPENNASAEFVDACGTVVSTEALQSFEWSTCSASLINALVATDACGNISTDTCFQYVSLEIDFTGPDIYPPADLTIGCSDPLPLPDLAGVVVVDNSALASEIIVEFVEDFVVGNGCDAVTKRIFRATDPCGNASLGVQFIHRASAVYVDAKVLLLGAVNGNGSAMIPSLNNLLPFTQPYALTHGYNGPEEVTLFTPDIIDWILVELVDPDDGQVIAQRAALVREDGEITDLDGNADVQFFSEPGYYNVVLRHRNHLDVISQAPIDFTDGSGTCDFTSGGASADGMYMMPGGNYAMYNGDVNGDNIINYNGAANDKNMILGEIGLANPNTIIEGYKLHDVNMDGKTMYNGVDNDKNTLLGLVGLLTPNHVIVGQLYE